MHEVELKSVVDDVAQRRALVESAGGALTFAGRLLDARYDLPSGTLSARDHVLRLRVYDDGKSRRAFIDWKGETRYEDGFKVREELSTSAGDADAIAEILKRLGLVVIMEIDRDIVQYELVGAVVRFEEYPQMDPLVEVEGAQDAIEEAIRLIGLPRSGYTAERLTEFMVRFETRTGKRALLSRTTD